MGKDYYNTLGISKEASSDDIKRAYKKLAKKYHPDISSEQNAEEKFKEVQEAYSTLSDSQKRQNYDAYGSDFSQFKGYGGGQGFGGFDFGGSGDFGFEDIFSSFGFNGFSDMFGGRKKRGGPSRGNDLEYRLNLTFMEAVNGANKTIKLDRMEKCETCFGSGGKKGTSKKTCDKCNGRGAIIQTRKTIIGTFQTQSTCPKCNGQGEFFEEPCTKCSGAGLNRVNRKIEVNIPAGVNTGQYLRLDSQGNAGEKGGHSGNLFVHIYVEPHDVFKRDNFDIYCEIPLTFAEVAIGTELEIPNVYGKHVKLKIPQGTQTSTIFKLKNQGIKHLDEKSYGDQFVKIIIQTPKKLSKKQRKLLEELAELDDIKLKRESFFGKMWNAFKS